MHFVAIAWTIQTLLEKPDTAFSDEPAHPGSCCKPAVQDYSKLTHTSLRQVSFFSVLWPHC